MAEDGGVHSLLSGPRSLNSQSSVDPASGSGRYNGEYWHHGTDTLVVESKAGPVGVIDASDSDFETIIADVGRHFTERFATTDAPRFMAIIAEMALRDEEIRQMLLQLQQNYIDRLAMVLEEGMDRGQLKDVDPESAAMLLKAIIDGLQAGYGIGYDPDIDRLVETSMRILGTGMLDEEKLEALDE
jgi:hypothetical protein